MAGDRRATAGNVIVTDRVDKVIEIDATSLLAIAAYLLSPSSTPIDRLALYLIPIQIVVLSRLPGLFAHADRPTMSIVTAVVAYSLAVQLVWLTFGQFAWAWLPYQNYLWTPTEDLEGFHRY